MTDRMTTWEFLRWYAANRTRAELAMIAVTETICNIAIAVVVAAHVPHVWAKLAAGAAALALTYACMWMMLGSQRVQQWIVRGQL